ncbi:uncharacterized protein LOC134534082 [Bacillus rossius redtenbacheri]|uniref:uncharacterized protein LOC134534082 n=1 Tax=Bacillus rossius redtenbacheri TaxID=93214 RepID=UPI002FDD3516
MHTLYEDKYQNTKASYKYYLKYYNENFRYRFGRPQIDVCSTCEELTTKLKSPHVAEILKRAAESELVVHKRRNQTFYKSLKQTEQLCKENPHVAGIVFDLMQNLPLPHIPVQEIFYLRQLWVNCFCVHDLKSHHSCLYVYHESVAKKGANEVCSFLLDYITHCVSKDVTDLYLYSDGCVGQYKNHSMIRMCLGLVQNKMLQNIVHCYPVRGHSFLPCDRDFGLFKKNIKKCDRIYTPKEYVSLLVHSKSNVKVKMVETEDILDFNTWWPRFFKKNCVAIECVGRDTPHDCKVNFAPSSFKEFRYSAAKPGVVEACPFIGGLVTYTFPLAQPSINNHFSMIIPKAYPAGKVPINRLKLQDIQKVVKYVVGDTETLAFYEYNHFC